MTYQYGPKILYQLELPYLLSHIYSVVIEMVYPSSLARISLFFSPVIKIIVVIPKEQKID